MGARITTSCSAWIVATMSRIDPVRAAQLGEQRVGHSARRRREHGVGVGEVFLEDVGELATGEGEAAPKPQAERVGGGRAVERDRDVGAPVDDDRFAVGIVDRPAPDVEDVADLFGPCSRSIRPKHSTAESSSSERRRWVRCQRTAALSNSPAARSSWLT